MPYEALAGLTKSTINTWLQELRVHDPALYDKLTKRMAKSKRPAAALAEEAALPESVSVGDMVAEAIIREGRPALPIKADIITREGAFIDADGEVVTARLLEHAAAINPILPLVGRIDVANYPANATYVGTGWLIDPDIVVTNRHVARLIARWDGRSYVFIPGRFGDPIEASVDWKHELDSDVRSAIKVESVIYIEENGQAPDIAFLKINRRSDGARRDRIALADANAAPGTNIAVIGYPARATPDVIPDQAWMDRIYGGRYDVKRIAPGLMRADDRGWAAHDCTTLGGNSGSVVVDMATGKAVALHFAGAYIINNYAVHASAIRDYLRRRPWQGRHEGSAVGADKPGKDQSAPTATTPPPTTGSVSAPPPGTAAVSFTIPLTISVSLGTPAVGAPTGAATTVDAGVPAASIDAAVQQFAATHRGGGILAVRSGLVIEDGRFSDKPCIHVAAAPERLAAVQQSVPAMFLGYPVAVRAASVGEQIEAQQIVTEATVTSTKYNDNERTGPKFSFAAVDETMSVLCHVGPERSWEVLSDFLKGARLELVSSMYEFHAQHIADVVADRLGDRVKMTLVIDNASRTSSNGPGQGDFDRTETFNDWADRFHFERIYAPEGRNGLIANSYHIKVTVREDERFWLSSGNWKNSSQPVIAPADRNNPARMTAGNREWHVVIDNPTLAQRFRNHIVADYKRSEELGGSLEAAVAETYVDVPIALEEAIVLEARRPSRIIESKTFNRRVRVKPLLTPDRRGAVYTSAVLNLIQSARNQLLFQIPYIDSHKESARGGLETLVKALIAKSKSIDDVRIILRSDHGSWIPGAQDMAKRGLDLDRCVRHIPKTHTKGMIVDGKRVLVGSHNWSGDGVTFNRDASLLFDDAEIAEYYKQAFELDWARGSEPIINEAVLTEAPRIATTAAPPPGFRRVTLEEFLEG